MARTSAVLNERRLSSAAPSFRTYMRGFWQQRSTLAFLMCLPLILIIAGLVVYPFFYSVNLSLLNKSETHYVGLDNFFFLFGRSTFWMVVRQSVLFTFTAVFFKALIGFICAHLIHNVHERGQRIWRGLSLVPWVIPPALSTLGWWWLFDPTYSAINWLLEAVGGPHIPWLSQTFWARFAVILVNIWYGAPFFLIMYLAALKSIPEELYDAAKVDGASAWQRLVYVTLPMLRNIVAITMLFSTIVTFANFDIVRVLTGGGPRDTTHLFGTWAFHLGIQGGDIPLGASVVAVHVPDPGGDRLLHPARCAPTGGSIIMATQVAPTSASAAFSRGKARGDRRWALYASYLFLAIFIVFFLFPPYYMLITSFKTDQEISSLAGNPWIINGKMTLDHYTNLLFNTAFPTYFKNTVIVTVCTVAISMVISILAAYSLARMRFFGSTVLATGVFLSYLVPETLLFIPLFKIVGGLHLLNSYWGLVLVYPIIAVPFCTWILIGYFSSIPRELDEAALIDGCNHLQMLIKIFIPVALPGIIAATIFAFTVSWAEFLYPLAFVYAEDQLVLTAGTVTTLIRGDVYHWGGLMAGALLAAAPPVILYAFLMDYYIAGLTSGATKG